MHVRSSGNLFGVLQVLENPGPTKPQRMTDSPSRRRSDGLIPEGGETRRLLGSRPHTPTSLLPHPTTPAEESRRVTPLNSAPLSSNVALSNSGNRLATPPHKLLLETSFTCTPVTSPEPALDLRKTAHVHSPAITWELLSALEEQLLLGVRESTRGSLERGEDWLAGVAPLASPETLSEASSVVSRASLLLREGRRASSALQPLHQSPVLNHRPPPTRLGTGYCFYVETPPLNSRRQVLPAAEQLPESSDDEEISPHSITPTTFITIDPIMPTPPTPRKGGREDSDSSLHLNPMPTMLGEDPEADSIQGVSALMSETVHDNPEIVCISKEEKEMEEAENVPDSRRSIGDTPDSPGSGPSRASSSGSSQSSHRVKFDLTTSQMSRDSGYGEKLNGYEILCANNSEWGIQTSPWGGQQQEYGRGQPSLVHHYVYSGVSPQLSPSSPANTDSFTSPLTSDPPLSRQPSLLPTPVDIPQITTAMSSQTTLSSTQPLHPLYKATPLLHDISRSPKSMTVTDRPTHRAESSV